MKNNWIETDYVYNEEWQYQRIYVNIEDFSMLRCQNSRGRLGTIIDTEDYFKVGEGDWTWLFKEYGLPALLKLLK